MTTAKPSENIMNMAQGNKVVNVSPVKTLQTTLEAMKGQIQAALPKHMSAERMVRIALTVARTTPKLMQCNQTSFIGAIVQASQLGLEPGLGSQSGCYLLPYGNDVQMIPSYQGLIEICRRSGQIKTIRSGIVREGDEFIEEYGMEEKFFHKINSTPENRITHYYAYAHLKDGGFASVTMTADEMEKHKNKYSKSANNGPWKSEPIEMGKKTVLRRLTKILPKSIELSAAVEAEEKKFVYNVDTQENEEFNLEPEKEIVDTETGEVLN